jgi:hypothetical protein
MSSSDNVTHKKARGEPSSLSSHKDNDSLKMPLRDNIYAECTDISNGYSHVNKHRNVFLCVTLSLKDIFEASLSL